MEENILDGYKDKEAQQIRRRSLMPKWIKFFVWLFMIFGVIMIPLFLMGISGRNVSLELYGYHTNEILSPTGCTLAFLFLFKGVVSFLLWFENYWGVRLGIFDASIGILLCILSMLGFSFMATSSPGIDSFYHIENYEAELKNIFWLKVPHHGSANNLNKELTELMSPKIAVISGVRIFSIVKMMGVI